MKRSSRVALLCGIASIMATLASGTRRAIASRIVGRQRAAFANTHPRTRPAARGYLQRSSSPHRFERNKALSSTMSTSADSKPPSGEEQQDWDAVLPFERNPHNSVKITVPAVVDGSGSGSGDDDPYDASTFRSRLEATVAAARGLGKSAVWMSVPISRARLVEDAAKSGFAYHHAEGDAAALCRWLPDGEGSRVPAYATHQVGVGALVINAAADEILCVREKRRNYRPWKIPGGLAELGEDLDEAAVREVLEETGVKCRFQNVLALRHVHGAQFGRSDLYFICRLEPIPNEDGEVPQPVPQEGEIEAVSWLPLNEYREIVNDDDVKIGHPMMSQVMKVVDQNSSIERLIVSSVVPGRKSSPLYHAPVAPNAETTP